MSTFKPKASPFRDGAPISVEEIAAKDWVKDICQNPGYRYLDREKILELFETLSPWLKVYLPVPIPEDYKGKPIPVERTRLVWVRGRDIRLRELALSKRPHRLTSDLDPVRGALNGQPTLAQFCAHYNLPNPAEGGQP